MSRNESRNGDSRTGGQPSPGPGRRVDRRGFLKIWSLTTGSLLVAACSPAAPAPPAASQPTRAPLPTQVPAIGASPVASPSPLAQVVAPAAAPSKPGLVKTFTAAYASDLVTMDPSQITGNPDYQIGEAVYSYVGRYPYDPPLDINVQPELTNWEMLDGARTYVFHLRKGVKFQKGYGELTADDIKWNWDRMADEKSGSRYFTDFAGGEIKVLDPQTVQVKFPEPYPAFIQASLAFRPGLIMSPRAFQEKGDKWNRDPIGTGAFEWESSQPGSSVTLKRFEDYWGARPKVDRIVVKTKIEQRTAVLAVAKGEIDAAYIADPDVAADVAKNTDPNTVLHLPKAGTSMYWLAYNMKRSPMDDVRVRQALRYAIDIEAIARDLYGGLAVPVASFLPPFMFGYTADVNRFQYNPDQARQLLKQANIASGWAPTLIGDSSSLPARRILEAVASYWNDVGVLAKVDLPERAIFLQKRGAGDYDVFGIGVGRIEPDQIATPYWRSDSPVNNSFYSAADDLINQAKSEPDPPQRAQLYANLQRKISEDSPAAFIAATSEALLVHKRVTGITGAGWQSRLDWSNVDVPGA